MALKPMRNHVGQPRLPPREGMHLHPTLSHLFPPTPLDCCIKTPPTPQQRGPTTTTSEGVVVHHMWSTIPPLWGRPWNGGESVDTGGRMRNRIPPPITDSLEVPGPAHSPVCTISAETKQSYARTENERVGRVRKIHKATDATFPFPPIIPLSLSFH